MILIDADILLKEGWVLHKMVGTTLYEMPLNHPDVPTVDAVEVVRCKDCEHFKITIGWNTLAYTECDHFDCDVVEDGFCAWGERRKDAKPVVRCKDCKWRGKLGCAVTIVDESDKPMDNDFCSWGERREDETN